YHDSVLQIAFPPDAGEILSRRFRRRLGSSPCVPCVLCGALLFSAVNPWRGRHGARCLVPPLRPLRCALLLCGALFFSAVNPWRGRQRENKKSARPESRSSLALHSPRFEETDQ